MKKLTALVLALALALLPVSAFAVDEPNALPGDTSTAPMEPPVISPGPDIPQGPFDDISGESNQNSILWCYDQGLLSGTGSGHFSPDKEVTRAMAAAVLFRSAGNVAAPSFPFEDVPANSWYAKPVQWAYARGYINGTSAHTFSPNNAVTRQDLVLMLRRQACCGDDVVTEGFAPADYESIAPYARNAVCWAYQEGILRADQDGNLNPRAKVSRGELASILKRIYDEPEPAFEIEAANIENLSVRSSDGRFASAVPAERVEKIVEFLNGFEAIEKEAPAEPVNPGGWSYYIDFASHAPDTNGLRITILPNGSLDAMYTGSDSESVTRFIGKQPATALVEYLDEYFEDIPFVDPDPSGLVGLVDLDASEIDNITIRSMHHNRIPYWEITEPAEIGTVVDALNAIEVYAPALQEFPEGWDYEIKVGGYTLLFLQNQEVIYVTLIEGEETATYEAALGTDGSLWQLMEDYFKNDVPTLPEED